MNAQQIRTFLHSTTARLAVSYLAIIMVLSLGFSFIIYRTSTNDLDRQIPPISIFAPDLGLGGEDFQYHHFFEQRISDTKHHIFNRLLALNLLVLAGGTAMSYYLARRTLEPIEEAMAGQSRFVSDASHELRTPLTAILTSNEVALRKPKLSLAQAKQLLISNTEDMARLKTLTDGLLSLSKLDNNLVLKPVKLQDVVTEAINQVLAAAQHKQIAIDDKVPKTMAMGDKDSLVRVLAILLDNAIKYSPNKSTIYLTGRLHNKQAELSVQDKGIGIAATDLPHIFERFYRADRARTSSTNGGHGIGLSIAQKIVEQHHGQLSVTTALNHGSTFTLTIPSA